jgi:addiction module RelE/StbE family toxin
MTIRWTPTALRDLESLHAYIAGDKPAAADATIDRFLRGIEALALNPGMGKSGRVRGTRELVVSPFVVAYEVQHGAVKIVAIIHGARRWPDSF